MTLHVKGCGLEQSHLHINHIEMRAVKLALSHFHLPPQSHVLVAMNNTTVVAFINKVGGT